MKKKFSIGGMVVGLLIVLFGILTVSGAFGTGIGTGGGTGDSSPYDSGYAKFGGDYYTYSVNNSAEAASAARAAASNARAAASNASNILDFLCLALGTFMIGTGLAVFCGFGVVFSGLKQEIGDVSEVSETKILEIPENVFEETQENENVQPIFENEENV